MASLREEARYILDDARDGICWIAVWKTGRSWHCEPMYGVEYTESRSYPIKIESHWDIDPEYLERLQEILREDPEACLVNGYYRNIGSLEEMTLESLVDGLRFQYGLGGNLEGIIEEL